LLTSFVAHFQAIAVCATAYSLKIPNLDEKYLTFSLMVNGLGQYLK